MGVLEGRVACITGGTRGIGRGIAEAFIREGACVVVNGRDAKKGQRALDEMDAGDVAHFVAGDVTQRADCEALVGATVDHFGKIDILVANAGGGSDYAPVAHLTDESMEDALMWNFWHTFWTMRAAFEPHDPAAVRPGDGDHLARGQGRQAGDLDLRRRPSTRSTAS